MLFLFVLLWTPNVLCTISNNNTYNCSTFNNIPEVLDYNVISLGFEANGISSIGDYLLLENNQSTIVYAIEFVFTIGTYFTVNPNYTNPLGFDLPIGLILYSVDNNGTTIIPGTQIYTNVTTFLVPWRPEPSLNCTSNRWRDPNGNCRSAMTVTIVFELGNGINLPGESIYEVYFNTRNHGFDPYGVSGPYDSLNVGSTNVAPSAGTYGAPGLCFFNISGVFQLQDGLAPYSPYVRYVNGSCYTSPSITSGTLTTGITPAPDNREKQSISIVVSLVVIGATIFITSSLIPLCIKRR